MSSAGTCRAALEDGKPGLVDRGNPRARRRIFDRGRFPAVAKPPENQLPLTLQVGRKPVRRDVSKRSRASVR